MQKVSYQDKSRFHAYRSKYQSRVPKILNELHLDSEVSPAPVSEDIKGIFPHIVAKGVKSVSFKKGEESDKIVSAMRIGCVLSGGQAPGGHNVIVGLYDYIKRQHKSSQLFGFLGGPKGIYTGKYMEITDETIDYFRNRGGFDMIRSGRDKIEKLDEKIKSL